MESDAGAMVVARARALIGVRFRPQGRSCQQGLDCLGLVAAATDIKRVPDDYSLRGGDIETANAGFEDAGFERVQAAEARPGDVLVACSGPGQLHGVVLTPNGYVHAHAGLRRVVETPGAIHWPVLAAWRHPGAGR